jgi:hypothetical protein
LVWVLNVNKRTTFEQCYRMGIHFLIVHMWLTSCVVAVMSIYCKRRRGSCPQSSKKIQDECLSIIRIEIHRDKRKGVLRLSQEAYLEKLHRNIVCMRVSLRVFSLSRVMVLGTFMFQESTWNGLNEYDTICFSCWKLNEWKDRAYPDIVRISGLFWQWPI